jgi:hypothetical protein
MPGRDGRGHEGHPELPLTPGRTLARFQREAKAVEADRRTHFLTMERVEGDSLDWTSRPCPDRPLLLRDQVLQRLPNGGPPRRRSRRTGRSALSGTARVG